MSTTVMSAYMKSYRSSHPEYYEKEKVRNALYITNRYKNDPEYKEKKREYARQRYYIVKAQKEQQSQNEETND